MYEFIINPHSRSGYGMRIWEELEKIIKEKTIPYRAHFTRRAKDGTRLARAITQDLQPHTIIVLGGDGTVNEVINGIIDHEKVTFGYIPIGSGNDFARGIGIPKDPFKALHLILENPHIQTMDIGQMKYKDKSRLFAVSAGIGFDADICHEVVVSPLKAILNRLKLGKLTYVCVAFHRLAVTSPCDFEVETETGQKTLYPKTYFIAFMNNPYEGGGVRFAPHALNNDRCLDLCIASGISKLKALMLFPMAFLGLHTRFKGVCLLRCKSIRVKTEHPLPIHTDGEPGFLQDQVTVSCLNRQMRIIVPLKK